MNDEDQDLFTDEGDTSSSEFNVFATGDPRHTSTRVTRSRGGSSTAVARTTKKLAAAAAPKGKAKAPPKTASGKGKAGRGGRSASAGDLSTPDKSTSRRGHKSKAQIEQDNMFEFMSQAKVTPEGKMVMPACFLVDPRLADSASNTAPQPRSATGPFLSSLTPLGI